MVFTCVRTCTNTNKDQKMYSFPKELEVCGAHFDSSCMFEHFIIDIGSTSKEGSKKVTVEDFSPIPVEGVGITDFPVTVYDETVIETQSYIAAYLAKHILKIVKGYELHYKEIAKVYQHFENSVGKRHASQALETAYVPSAVEGNNVNNNYFYTKRKPGRQFTMLLPPPNVTGSLHLGHALAVTIQDVLVRWNRMQGVETLWVPGIDHAGIATQLVVEKKIWKERKQTKQDLGRKQFLQEIMKWKDEKANTIGQQLKQMGASLDWSKQIFTMDPAQSYAVTEAFIKLFDCGLIYRSDYLVNWSCALGTAISDIEVQHLKVSELTAVSVPGYETPVKFGVLTKFAYKLCESDREIVVATTRPETILGDTAIAVHPNDERYTSFIGQTCWHPFRNEKISIICDEMVDPDFGTGAVKVTPAHDHIDFEIGKRHGLNLLQVIDEKGHITFTQFKDMPRFDARDVIVNELHRLKLLRGQQDHEMVIPICSRSKDVVEFLLKPQWFVKCTNMAEKALNAVKDGSLEIEPKNFAQDWNNWLENIRDWCISRQLWWGHRIPVYCCRIDGEKSACYVAASSLEAAKIKAAQKLDCEVERIIAVQDEDVLDTWFSSALLPFSAFGWPKETDLNQFYPLSLMETGHDILFFWVARMVMLGIQLTGKLPFSKVLLHGIIRDGEGRKMSKSLGNVIAPEDVILGRSLQELETNLEQNYNMGILTKEELAKALQSQRKMFPEGIPDCGLDALRFTLCSHNIKNHYINFDVQECKINKFFGNKIWQATKFTNKWIDSVNKTHSVEKTEYKSLTKIDKWMLSRISFMVEVVNQNMKKYDFHIVTNALKNCLYYEFCDIYLEATKRGLQLGTSSRARNHCWVLSTCLDVGLRCLSPFAPNLSIHLHERLFKCLLPERQLDFPEFLPLRDTALETEINQMMELVVSIRRLKRMFNITAKNKARVILVTPSSQFLDLIEVIEDLAGCDKIIVQDQIESVDVIESVSYKVGGVTVHLLISPELRHSFGVNLQHLEKKRIKLVANLDKIKKMVSTDGYKLNATIKTQENNQKKMKTLEEDIARIMLMKELSKTICLK
ncbi:hypothetical protein Trydic_g12976 [Trypoxylus dichotomus]